MNSKWLSSILSTVRELDPPLRLSLLVFTNANKQLKTIVEVGQGDFIAALLDDVDPKLWPEMNLTDYYSYAFPVSWSANSLMLIPEFGYVVFSIHAVYFMRRNV